MLDLLFRGGRALRAHPRGREGGRARTDSPRSTSSARARQHANEARARRAAPLRRAHYELDPGLLAVLTEYEEHRLRTNIEQGQRLYRLRVQFQLATIDAALDDLKLTRQAARRDHHLPAHRRGRRRRLDRARHLDGLARPPLRRAARRCSANDRTSISKRCRDARAREDRVIIARDGQPAASSRAACIRRSLGSRASARRGERRWSTADRRFRKPARTGAHGRPSSRCDR